MTENYEFDAHDYWRKRHIEHKGSVQAVAHLGQPEAHNERGIETSREALGMVLGRLKPKSILDLGCGAGTHTGVCLEHCERYLGVDVSPEATKEAQDRYPKANFWTWRIENLRPCIGARFDVVLSAFVFCHLVDERAWKDALLNAASFLRDDGVFLLVDHINKDRGVNKDHVAVRSRRDYDLALGSSHLRFDGERTQALREGLPEGLFARNLHAIVRR